VAYKIAIYLAVSAAIWLGGQPWRLRDAIEWMQRVPGRARRVGALLSLYGGGLAALALATR
jgi:hypothetical protein